MPEPLVTLHPATPSDQTMLRRLMQLYMYDFSEFENVEINEDGTFGHHEFVEEQLSLAHEVFVIRTDGELAGFATLTRGSYLTHDPAVTDMTQFFIIRGCRKRGVGASVAQQLFARHPGPWEVRVIESNTAARAFWRKTIASFTTGSFAESHNTSQRLKGYVFTFTTPARA